MTDSGSDVQRTVQMLADIAAQLQRSLDSTSNGQHFQESNPDEGQGLSGLRSHTNFQTQRSLPSPRPKVRRGTTSSLERQSLFLGQRRDSRETFRPPPQNSPVKLPFGKTFVVLSKKFESINRMKPSSSDLAELNDAGMGELVVQLNCDDTATIVLNKLVECCPILASLSGWVVMLKAVSTNSNSLEMIAGKPILSGLELQKLNARVYVAPLKKDVNPSSRGLSTGYPLDIRF